jgi:hypothetical protein
MIFATPNPTGKPLGSVATEETIRDCLSRSVDISLSDYVINYYNPVEFEKGRVTYIIGMVHGNSFNEIWLDSQTCSIVRARGEIVSGVH